MSARWALTLAFLTPALAATCCSIPPDTLSASGTTSVVEQAASVQEAGFATDAAEEAPAWRLPTPELAYGEREGRALFLHYCATCHGPQGQGDGFNAYNLDPRPRDLSDAAFQAERTDADLVEIIRFGGGAAGLSTGMPPWGETLGRRQIGYLVEFLRTLPSTEGSADQPGP